MPSTAASRTRVISTSWKRGGDGGFRSPSPFHLLPVVLRVFGLSGGHGRWVNEDCGAVLPLLDENPHAALRLTDRIPAHRALDRLIGARVEGVDELLVVDATGLCGGPGHGPPRPFSLGPVGPDGSRRATVP